MHSSKKPPSLSQNSDYKTPCKFFSVHRRLNMIRPKQTPIISTKRVLIFSLLVISIVLLLLSHGLQSHQPEPFVRQRLQAELPLHLAATSMGTEEKKLPEWYDVVLRQTGRRRLKVGVVNAQLGGQNRLPSHLADVANVEFEKVPSGLEWAQFFPEWIDERQPTCPEIPMPELRRFQGLDVVVAAVPCGGRGGNGTIGGFSRQGVRDLFRLQVNLVVANLAVEGREEAAGPVYVAFVGGCEPMWEIFRCDDLIWKKGEDMVYRPNIAKLRHKVLMPFGSCDLARPFLHQPGPINQASPTSRALKSRPKTRPKQAYVTLLHSSEHYVCGAIALAQSILQTNTTNDLLLLADNSISRKSIQGLRNAGWKVKLIQRIRSPGAREKAYNEWNYSKLRVWQLTDYDKVIFIDADFIVLHNLDHFFSYPQLSASGNDKWLFNSGVMVVEPSQCFFETLMKKRFELESYNGGDQGFLNEVFPWWHRLTRKVNYLKVYMTEKESRVVPGDSYTIHYLGLKPWACYKDYDCNWDMWSRQKFASDMAHRRWWKVYDEMPKRLRPFCGLTEKMDARIRKWRGNAGRDKNYTDKHWRIVVKDPRRHRFVSPIH